MKVIPLIRAIARLTPFQIACKLRKEGEYRLHRRFPRPFPLPAWQKVSSLAPAALIEALDHRPFYPGWEETPDFAPFPAAREALLAEADALVEGNFTILGFSPFRFEGEIDWGADPYGDPQWTIALNWCKHFITLGKAYLLSGNEAYARVFCAQGESWIRGNPYGSPVAWTAQLVSLRIQAWIWAYFSFRHSPHFSTALKERFLRALWAQIEYLDHHLEWDVDANHLLSGLFMLIQAGALFPEFKRSAHWLGRMKAVERQLLRQVHPDGVSAEQSPYYHVLVGQILFETLQTLRLRKLPVPDSWLSAFSKMADFTLYSTKPDGRIPLLSDSMALLDVKFTPTDLLAAAAFTLDRSDLPFVPTEKLLWFFPARQPSWLSPYPSKAFPRGGYVVLRSGWERDSDYLIFDCGPFGLRRNPGHGHADALSLELQVRGEDLVVDAGPGSYQGDAFRQYFRGTRGHNTVVVEGRDQSEIWGAFRVGRTAQARLLTASIGKARSLLVGEHDGYRPVIHRRYVLWKRDRYLLVFDRLWGNPREACLHWHFAGPLERLDEKTFRKNGQNKIRVRVEGAETLEILEGQADPPAGWLSEDLGHRKPAPELIAHGRDWFLTLFSTQELPLEPLENGVVLDGERLFFGDQVLIDGRPYA